MMQKEKLFYSILFLIIASLALFGPYTIFYIINGGILFSIILLTGITIFSLLLTFILFRNNIDSFDAALFFLILLLSYPVMHLQISIFKVSFPGFLYIPPILVYLLLIRFRKVNKEIFTWGFFKDIDKISWFLIFLIIPFSSCALLLWVILLNPDLTIFISWITEFDTIMLIGGGIFFVVSNSFAEEFAFRAVLYSGLSKHISSVPVIIVIQALMFGLLHISGFPGGPIGVVLVFIWGIFLGILRHRTEGLLAPVICHICADTTIIMIVIAMKDYR